MEHKAECQPAKPNEKLRLLCEQKFANSLTMKLKQPHAQLRASLKLSGLKASWVADKVGVSKSYLSQILSGKRPLPENLKLQVEALLFNGK